MSSLRRLPTPREVADSTLGIVAGHLRPKGDTASARLRRHAREVVPGRSALPRGRDREAGPGRTVDGDQVHRVGVLMAVTAEPFARGRVHAVGSIPQQPGVEIVDPVLVIRHLEAQSAGLDAGDDLVMPRQVRRGEVHAGADHVVAQAKPRRSAQAREIGSSSRTGTSISSGSRTRPASSAADGGRHRPAVATSAESGVHHDADDDPVRRHVAVEDRRDGRDPIAQLADQIAPKRVRPGRPLPFAPLRRAAGEPIDLVHYRQVTIEIMFGI